MHALRNTSLFSGICIAMNTIMYGMTSSHCVYAMLLAVAAADWDGEICMTRVTGNYPCV